MDIFEEIVAQKKAGKPTVMATVIEAKGSTPRGAGARMLVKGDGSTVGTVGGGAVEKIVIDEAMGLMKIGGTKLISGELKDMGMTCGGGMSLFLETLIPAPRLYVFGAGHIGRVLSQMGKLIGFNVTIVDNRKEVADVELHSWASEVVVDEYKSALKKLTFDDNTYIVILTHKHVHDYEVLEECVGFKHRYIGMIGSKSKVAKCFEMLREKGVDEEVIKTIHSPVGIDIGGNTPAEIAVSISAELVAIRNQGEKTPSS